MFDIPNIENLEEVVVNKEVAEGNIEPLMIYSDRQEQYETSA